MDQTPIIACLKWGAGYPANYTNVLFRALSAIMSTPFRFVCITDHAGGLDSGIETAELPSFALNKANWTPGMWPKLSVFKPDLFPKGAPVLLMDVDVVVTQDLTPLFERVQSKGGLHIIYDWHDTHERWFPSIWNTKRKSNSSVVGFISGEQHHIWQAFKDADHKTLNKVGHNDQLYIHELAHERHHWPAPWVLSFKKSLAWHMPTSFFLSPSAPPQDCFIVAFHGDPNPEDCAQSAFKRWGSPEKFGYFPVPWVKNYWDRFHKG